MNLGSCQLQKTHAIKVDVKALATIFQRQKKSGLGNQTEIPVPFAGVTFTPGHYLYADKDGIVVSPTKP